MRNSLRRTSKDKTPSPVGNKLSEAQRDDAFRNRLIDFYRIHNPSLIDTVESTLVEWKGREDQLFSSLAAKYEADTAKIALQEDYLNTVDGLKKLYKDKILPLEQAYKFDLFFSPFLNDVDFDAKPMVLLVGQYSVGKTTFIKHLLNRDFPGIRIGPEPTTDKFTAVMKGTDDQIIPGNALVVAADKPFHALTKFGAHFLNRFECSQCNSKLLDSMTLIDTPGVLSGEKQRIGRNYDFTAVIEWFAERCDRIVLLFDAHKLDVSDEFKRSIEALKGHEEKIRVVLNKSDSISQQQLMRVYGSLMWSLGKVVRTPEVLRVYIGSFWDKPLDESHECYSLFESEHQDLLSDLRSLPRNSAIRKVNELVKRARLAKVHALIIAHLKKEMPSFFGKNKKQAKILDNLHIEFQHIAQKHRLPPGDFPNIDRFRATLHELEISKFPALKEKSMKKLDQVLGVDIPNLMKAMRHPNVAQTDEQAAANPFSEDPMAMLSLGSSNWKISNGEKTESDNIFYSAALVNGMLSGSAAKRVFEPSGLQNSDLFTIWSLADVDKNNQLDADEFAVAMHLVNMAKRGEKLPDVLPPDLVPPSKRG